MIENQRQGSGIASDPGGAWGIGVSPGRLSRSRGSLRWHGEVISTANPRLSGRGLLGGSFGQPISRAFAPGGGKKPGENRRRTGNDCRECDGCHQPVCPFGGGQRFRGRCRWG